MQIVINISEEEIKAAVIDVMVKRYENSLVKDYGVKDAVADASREIARQCKAEIVGACVDRVSREVMRKGTSEILAKTKKSIKNATGAQDGGKPAGCLADK